MTNTIRIATGLAATALLLALSGCGEDGSYWNENTVQLHSDKVGRIEAVGEDIRAYEFTPQTMPNTQCIFIAGDAKGGLYCEPKSGAGRATAPKQ